MTAQQRTQAIWDQFENMPVCNDDTKKWMLHAIESAIIEHSNAELERRREMLRTGLHVAGDGQVWRQSQYIGRATDMEMALWRAALKALEGGE